MAWKKFWRKVYRFLVWFERGGKNPHEWSQGNEEIDSYDRINQILFKENFHLAISSEFE